MAPANPVRSSTALFAIVAFSCWLLPPQPALAISITFTKIADTSTPIPGTATNFQSFGAVAIDAGTVAFLGGAIVPTQTAGVFTGSTTEFCVEIIGAFFFPVKFESWRANA